MFSNVSLKQSFGETDIRHFLTREISINKDNKIFYIRFFFSTKRRKRFRFLKDFIVCIDNIVKVATRAFFPLLSPSGIRCTGSFGLLSPSACFPPLGDKMHEMHKMHKMQLFLSLKSRFFLYFIVQNRFLK